MLNYRISHRTVHIECEIMRDVHLTTYTSQDLIVTTPLSVSFSAYRRCIITNIIFGFYTRVIIEA